VGIASEWVGPSQYALRWDKKSVCTVLQRTADSSGVQQLSLGRCSSCHLALIFRFRTGKKIPQVFRHSPTAERWNQLLQQFHYYTFANVFVLTIASMMAGYFNKTSTKVWKQTSPKSNNNRKTSPKCIVWTYLTKKQASKSTIKHADKSERINLKIRKLTQKLAQNVFYIEKNSRRSTAWNNNAKNK